jgi:uncharacterized membrane protein YphA (DoxX/SURF4 family)
MTDTMETVLWILQILLAGAFAFAGLFKLTQRRAKYLESQPSMADFTDSQVKGIGVLEVLAAIGLIAPAALGVVPLLTAFAAAGVVLLMVGAARHHLRHSETQMLPVNFVLGAIALFVAIERFGPHAL